MNIGIEESTCIIKFIKEENKKAEGRTNHKILIFFKKIRFAIETEYLRNMHLRKFKYIMINTMTLGCKRLKLLNFRKWKK